MNPFLSALLLNRTIAAFTAMSSVELGTASPEAGIVYRRVSDALPTLLNDGHIELTGEQQDIDFEAETTNDS